MVTRILCVDDEPNVLEAFERQLRRHFDLHTAVGPEIGLKVLSEQGPFAVVVSDLRMPEMDGIEFLTRVRRACPDTVRIMLTANADLGAAMAAVNDGKIFQFLTKPCPADILARSLESALEQYRLITSERELLERTLHGSVEILTEVLSLVNPAAFSKAQRIRRYVRHMVETLQLPDRWQYELAAMLSQVGCVVVPPEIIDKAHLGRFLSADEQTLLASQKRVGHKLVGKVPRLELVARMVAEQSSGWPGSETVPEPVRTGAHLLRLALDFDETIMRGKSAAEALIGMRDKRDYNAKYLAALQRLRVGEAISENKHVSLAQLRPGMVIAADLYSKTGVLLLAKGQEVTESAVDRIESFAKLYGIAEPIVVAVPGAQTSEPAAPAQLAPEELPEIPLRSPEPASQPV
jgi:CheY-like chemotaxis protein